MGRKFGVNDRVYHRGMDEYGTVIAVNGDVVDVQYDRKGEKTGKHWTGKYDAKWFDMYPDGLVRVSGSTP